MIFVTVGTIKFDDLVRTVDQAVGAGRLPKEVVLQTANGSYRPFHCEHFRSAATLAPYYNRADLVIGHGGTGTTLEVLERGLRLISVVNPAMQDDHQREFIEALEKEKYLWYCRDLKVLPEFVHMVRRDVPRRTLRGNLAVGVSTRLDKWKRPRVHCQLETTR